MKQKMNYGFASVVVVTIAIICVSICDFGTVYASKRSPETTADSIKPHQWQTVQMRVTAYCSCPLCCGEYSDGITANGHKIRPGDTFVAADKKYAFGTEMIIAGYSNSQLVKVLDRGGAIIGDRLDVFFDTHQKALNWGVKYLAVKVRTN